MTTKSSSDGLIALPPPVELGLVNSVLMLLGLSALATANPLEGVFAVFQLKLLLKSYWRQNTPPVILLLFLIPWLEISTGILEANIRGESLDVLLHGTGKTAYWLSSIGLLAVHFGFIRFFEKSQVPSLDQLKSSASKLSLARLILLYFLVGPATNFVASFIGRASSLYQFVTYLNEISLALLIIICLRQVILNELNRIFILFIGIVLVLSFYSFFSEWRLVLFALVIALGTVEFLTQKQALSFILLALFFANVIFVWQGVKPIYRAYLTGQESLQGSLISQSVNRSRAESISKFFELTQQFYSGELQAQQITLEIDSEELLYSTLRRVGYLEFMALTLNNVPTRIEHEGGKLLRDNLSFALIPRFLNPNKGVKDDGAKVEKYTLFMVSENSSFSLGHYIEYYIDFGKWGMMLVLVFFGSAGGWVYRFIQKQSSRYHPLFLIGILFVTLQQWGSFQNDAIWLYGLTFFGFICHLFLFRPIYRALASFSKIQ